MHYEVFRKVSLEKIKTISSCKNLFYKIKMCNLQFIQKGIFQLKMIMELVLLKIYFFIFY